jgi:hypothetical protein
MDLLGKLSLKELLLNTAILALVFRVIWSSLSEIFNRMRQLLSRRVRIYEIDLNQYNLKSDSNVDFCCLLIRYGTDSYLKSLASDGDKFDGRLQNKILPITLANLDKRDTRLILRLPVHQRIGTQFKCFAEVRNPKDMEAVHNELKGCERIHGISVSSSQFRNRIYFLLKDFGTSKSVDGIENNICYPV